MINKLNSIRTIKSFSFFKNTNYIQNNSTGSSICIKNENINFKERSLYITNYICSLKLTSIESYNSGIKNIFNFKYNIPIYLNKSLILIPSRSIKHYDNVWINYSEVLKVKLSKENFIIITFKDGTILETTMNLNYYNKQLNQIILIEDYLTL